MDVREKLPSEKRLIDADALLKAIRTDYFEHFTQYHDTDQIALIDMVCDDIEESPTVDSVEVIRCRECKYHYWEQETCHGKGVHYCKLPHMRGVEVFKEFFCYYGERKEGAE